MLIGICGLAGSGKDTSADHLVRKHRFVKVSFADPLKRVAKDIYAFSDEQLWGPSAMRNAPDKRYVRELHERHDWQDDAATGGFRCTRCDLLGGQATPQCVVYLTPRYCLQQLGTEWGRRCYPSTWVDYAIRTAGRLRSGECVKYSAKEGITEVPFTYFEAAGGVVIPDVRFQNEIDAIRGAGGKVLRVVRDGAGLTGAAGLHPSEAEQAAMPNDLFDAVISNNADIKALGVQLDAVLKGWT